MLLAAFQPAAEGGRQPDRGDLHRGCCADGEQRAAWGHAARDGAQGAAAGGGRQDEFGAAQLLQLPGGIAGLESSLREGSRPRKSSGNADEAGGLFDPHAR